MSTTRRHKNSRGAGSAGHHLDQALIDLAAQLDRLRTALAPLEARQGQLLDVAAKSGARHPEALPPLGHVRAELASTIKRLRFGGRLADRLAQTLTGDVERLMRSAWLEVEASGLPATEAEIERLQSERDALCEQIARTPPKTLAGVSAHIRAALDHFALDPHHPGRRSLEHVLTGLEAMVSSKGRG